jgi:hypothetical protein
MDGFLRSKFLLLFRLGLVIPAKRSQFYSRHLLIRVRLTISGASMSSDAVKSTPIIDRIITLRLAVGYLGQRKQAGWWDCDFLDATGIRFLETTFPRTAWAAALRSTTEAACIVHDQALGRVSTLATMKPVYLYGACGIK